MDYEYNTYLTSDRSMDIEFLFVEIAPSNWRAYILSDIAYGNKPSGASDVHRLVEEDADRKSKVKNFIRTLRGSVNDNSPLFYICWSATIDSLPKARDIAAAWSEITAYYVKNGGSFPAIQQILTERNII